ncbi:MAG TPA: CDP-alcohol phosphatidyltransferase family protein, partial [Gemmatimonadota bacterium]
EPAGARPDAPRTPVLGPARPHEVGELRLATLPNLLSVLRLLLVGPSIVALQRQADWGTLPVLALVVVALGSDAVDGLLARGRGAVTSAGRMLDPLADKVYLGGVLLFLAVERGFPLVLVGAVLARDVLLVAGGALIARRYGVVFTPSLAGKISTLLLSLLIVAWVLRADPDLPELARAARAAAPWLVAGSLAAVLVSLGGYATTGVRFVSRARRADRARADSGTAVAPPGKGAAG